MHVYLHIILLQARPCARPLYPYLCHGKPCGKRPPCARGHGYSLNLNEGFVTYLTSKRPPLDSRSKAGNGPIVMCWPWRLVQHKVVQVACLPDIHRRVRSLHRSISLHISPFFERFWTLAHPQTPTNSANIQFIDARNCAFT